MKQLFEIYTTSGNADDIEEIKNEVEEIMSRNNHGFDQLARYAVEIDNNRNILIELDVPEINESQTIFMTAYEYEGSLEDYNCNNEIACIDFNGDWENLKANMAHFAGELMDVYKRINRIQ